ncbi:MAG: hypothetical protein WA071_27950 [Undibacterium umbellatum]
MLKKIKRLFGWTVAPAPKVAQERRQYRDARKHLPRVITNK